MPKRKSEGKKSARGGSASGGKNKNKLAEGPAPMPSLIFSEGTLATAKIQQEKAPPPLLEQIKRNYNPTARNWMWVGVATLSVIIFVLWGFALKLQLSTIQITKSPEGTLLNRSKKDWDVVFAETKKEQTEKQTIQNQLKTIVNQFVAAAIATTTSSSTDFSTTNSATSTAAASAATTTIKN